MVSERRCPTINAEGNPCSAYVEEGKTFCVWHDPERQAERAEKQRKGGQNKATRLRARRLLRESQGMADIQARLLLAYEQVHDGELDSSVGAALATMARALVVVAGVAQFEDRLDAMQREIAELKGVS